MNPRKSAAEQSAVIKTFVQTPGFTVVRTFRKGTHYRLISAIAAVLAVQTLPIVTVGSEKTGGASQ